MLTDMAYQGVIDLNDHVLDLNHFSLDNMGGSAIRTGTVTNPLEFKGKMHIYTYLNVVGDVIVTDTVRNINNNNAWFNIYGSLENNGAILTNTYSNYRLSASITGDILHNGIWHTEYTNLNGTSEQFITCQPGKYFQTSMVDNNPDTIHANSELNLQGLIDLNDHTLDMNGHNMNFISESTVYRGTILNPNIINGFVNIRGTLDIIGDLTVEDTVQNTYSYDGYLNIDGNLNNNGLIRNNPPYSELYITLSGDITNNGDWTNQRTMLVGDHDQTIDLVYDHPIDGQVVFNSEINAPYQWYYNGAILDSPDFNGETQANLQWLVPVSDSWYGSFYCESDTINSRAFTVQGIYPVFINATVFLEGPFNGTEMNTTLNASNQVPFVQPYNQAPWNYTGTEAVASIPNQDIVDWILVELRDAADPVSATSQTMVDRKAAFLLKDGSIVDLDGSSVIEMNADIQNNVFMVIWHRNHVGIMSSGPLPYANGIYHYDFSSGPLQVYGGSNAHKEIATGIWGLTGGDGNSDNQINNGDKNDVWVPQAGTTGYIMGDFNMDTQVNNSDKNDVWVPNTGLGGQVPQ